MNLNFITRLFPYEHWQEVMKSELNVMEVNNTWTVVSFPENSIGCKWIFKIKYRVDGSIEHYKARLVAKGYSTKGIGLS